MRLSSCHATGKVPFGCKATAKKAAKSMTSRFGDKQ
jgi:hypothetical protein